MYRIHPSVPYLCLLPLMLLAVRLPAQQDSPFGHSLQPDLERILQNNGVRSAGSAQSGLAGFTEIDLREAPGSVVIITREQIAASGARDLMELLMLIPGIQLGRDVDDVVGVGIRGLWANEGKCQFMLNGIPLNELDFGTYALGARIPLDHVSRIEIMLGAGSVVHGGMAALGVIDIITRDALDFDGVHLNLNSALSNGRNSLNALSLSGNHKVGKDTYLNYATGFTKALRSTWQLPLPDGRMVNYADSTEIFSQSHFIGIRRGNLDIKLMAGEYSYHATDAPYNVSMRNLSTDVQREGSINPRWHYRARLMFTHQVPWQNTNTDDPDLISTNTTAQRTSASMIFDYHHDARLRLNAGVQVFRQLSVIQANGPGMVFSMNDSRRFLLSDIAFFSELNLRTRLGNFTGSGRLEYNPFTDWLFAPRVVYNKVWRAFHIKAIYGRAFKTPTIQNVNLGPAGQPLLAERVQTSELEVGYKPSRQWEIAINAHKTDLFDPIVYVYDSIRYDNYINRPFSGAMGYELRYAFQSEKTTLMGSYSYYTPSRRNAVPEMDCQCATQFLGMPSSKLSLIAGYRIHTRLQVHSSVMRQSEMQALEYAGDEASLAQVEYPAATIWNAGVRISPGKPSGMLLSLDVNNILNQKFYAASPFNNGLPGLPLYHRSFLFNLTYRIPV